MSTSDFNLLVKSALKSKLLISVFGLLGALKSKVKSFFSTESLKTFNCESSSKLHCDNNTTDKKAKTDDK